MSSSSFLVLCSVMRPGISANHAWGSTPLSFAVGIRVQTMAAVKVTVLAVSMQISLRQINSDKLLK